MSVKPMTDQQSYQYETISAQNEEGTEELLCLHCQGQLHSAVVAGWCVVGGVWEVARILWWVGGGRRHAAFGRAVRLALADLTSQALGEYTSSRKARLPVRGQLYRALEMVPVHSRAYAQASLRP